MNTRERQESIREVERNTERLVKRGWRVQQVTYTDEPGEPFQATIRVSKDGDSVMAGPL